MPPARGYPGSGSAFANAGTSTPLGISTASEPSDSICQRLASSETAMRPLIFSRYGASTPWKVLSTNDFVVEVWKVATIGPSAIFIASIERLGAFGSWMCSTSKSLSTIHRRTRA